MANVTLWGASYSDVPAVTLPQTGGGTASFTDVSDTTAAAGDVATGKYFYTAAGVKTEGTASGGGGAEEVAKLLDRSITSISNSVVTTLGKAAFSKCQYLTSVDFPNVITTEQSVFAECSRLTTVNLPSLQNFKAGNTFESSGIVTFVAPTFNGLWASNVNFLNCFSLKTVDMNAPYRLGGGSAFSNCRSFDTLILRKTSGIVNMDSTNAVGGTPFATNGTGGTVYVPNALIATYQSATNWSTLYQAGTCTFVKIEGSIYETQYADGTPVT